MCKITTAMLVVSLGKIVYHRMDTGQINFAEDLGIPFDRFLGGCLGAAEAAGELLDERFIPLNKSGPLNLPA